MFIIRMLRNSPPSKIEQNGKTKNKSFITKTQQNLDIFGSDMLVDFFK